MKDSKTRKRFYSCPNKRYLFLITTVSFTIMILAQSQLRAQLSTHFVTTWKTDNPGTSDTSSITIPTFTGDSYLYDVDWNNDGIFEQTGITGTMTHDFGVAGIYTIRIKGTFPRIYFNNGGDKMKILSIDQWGDVPWENMNRAFYGASDLVYHAVDTPDLSGVIDLSWMFYNASSFNGDLRGWNVSGVTDMRWMFNGASSFNGDVSDWDVSGVTLMRGMFARTSIFNGDLSSWDVSNVTDFSNMFYVAIAFNGDLSSWDVSSGDDMTNMFSNARVFNGDISGWDVDSVMQMSSMFNYALAFNGDISSWDVSSVTKMITMFNSASSFNGDISGWDVSNVTDMTLMFNGASAFNRDLSGWDVSNVTDMHWMFNGASAFNGDISTWDVDSVADMSRMFRYATSFNGDLSSWDVSGAIDMSEMFANASAFSSDLSNWNVSSVTDMGYMFYEATAFDGDLSGWDISNVTDMNNMLYGVGLTVQNYDSLLIGWAALPNRQSNVTFHGGNSMYCDGILARQALIDDTGWTITDGGVSNMTNTWTGAVDSDWNNPSNWSAGNVPLICDEVIIPTGFSITISSGEVARCNTLDLSTGSNLLIETGGLLIVELPDSI